MLETAAEPLPPSLAHLPSTRRQLVMALKLQGEMRADDLAERLAITVSAVRQHLNGLTAIGLVGHREVKAGPGRPKHLYHLTAAGEGLFPRNYSELANELLSSIEQASPDLVDEAFERRRRRRVEQARARIAGKPLEAQVAELARILDEDGYLAEFVTLDGGGFRLIEHNCAILGIAQHHARACSSELALLRELLPDAEVERTAHMIAGAHLCAYDIVPHPA